MSESECREVLDILDMYRAITFGLSQIDKEDPINKHRLARFIGFDGNNEGQLMSYVRYFIMDLDRYDELKQREYPSFNSHARMLETYRAMLERWQKLENKFDLSREQITAILEAK